MVSNFEKYLAGEPLTPELAALRAGHQDLFEGGALASTTPTAEESA